MKLIAALFFLLSNLTVHAEEGMVKLDLSRNGAHLPMYVMSNPHALATLILLPGGDAGTGKIIDGKPTSGNFLARSRGIFFNENFNVVVIFRASDLAKLDYSYRVQEHVAEIAKVINFSKEKFQKPIWLVGTSRGTVSGAAAAIALGGEAVQGLVLASSVTNNKIGAINTQSIGELKIPVLVVHHRYDACKICVPSEASRITSDLISAPVKKFVMIGGGTNPEGDPCGARHWHGFINYEKETVKLMSDWIKKPLS
ncbi:MAG: alpha/beta hydrolase [Alcaligenaceae bacterium]|nr:MAG: alpha/beta hydrolase [Alcaligenaceae bacterium]